MEVSIPIRSIAREGAAAVLPDRLAKRLWREARRLRAERAPIVKEIKRLDTEMRAAIGDGTHLLAKDGHVVAMLSSSTRRGLDRERLEKFLRENGKDLAEFETSHDVTELRVADSWP